MATGITPSQRSLRLGRMLVFAACILALLLLQIYHFRHRDLRLDEILIAHAGLSLTPSQITLWLAFDTHPPLWTLLGAAWSSVVGLDAGLLRFQSTLYGAVTFALLYRLGAVLFRPSVGLMAVVIAGTWSVYSFYTHEFRPYAPLALWTVACQVTFLAWLRRPRLSTALALVVSGIGAIYTHYFGVYVIAALALVFMVFVRWDARRYLRAAGLFAAIALSYGPWLLPFVHSFTVTRPGGIEYAVGGSLDALRDVLAEFAPQPAWLALGLLVLLPLAFIRPLRNTRRDPKSLRDFWRAERWRKAYPLLFTLLVLGLAFVAHQFVESITLRNLTLVAPTLALLIALVLDRLHVVLRVGGLALLVLPGVTQFVVYERQLPFEAMAKTVAENYTADMPIIFNTGRGPSTNVGVAYNLMDRVPGLTRELIIHLGPVTTEIAPDPLPNEIIGDSAQDISAFRALVGAPDAFWYVHAPVEDERGLRFLDALDGEYAPVQTRVWNEDGMLRVAVTLYQRITP